MGNQIPSELRVWSCFVVVGSPASERDAGLGQRCEQRLVQQFIPEPTVKALDEGILRGFAGRDVMPGDATLIGPGHDGGTDEFGAAVADQAALSSMRRSTAASAACSHPPARPQPLGLGDVHPAELGLHL